MKNQTVPLTREQALRACERIMNLNSLTMKVVCVNHDCFEAELPYGPDDPQIGDTCIVIAERIGYDEESNPGPCYELDGYTDWYYDKRNFAPLTGLDETTLVTEEFEEKYCVPVKR